MRASDERRERTVAELRERALDGCLTLDTFASRVDSAYRARTEEELSALLEDLPRGWGVRLRCFLRGLFSRPRDGATAAPALEIEVRLPRARAAVTVGRSADCDVVVGEETVSRHH